MFTDRKSKGSRLATAVTAATLTLSSGMAAAQGLYLGAGGGESKLKEPSKALSSLSTSVDDKDSAWKAFLGYQFQQTPVALELGYVDFGKFTGSTPVLGVIDTWKAKGAYLDLVGGLPFNNQFSLFAKVGALRWRVEDTPLAGGASRHDGTDLTFGAGAQFDFNKNVGARIEWERFKKAGNENSGGRSDVGLASASLVFRLQ